MTTKTTQISSGLFPLTADRVKLLISLARSENLHELTVAKGNESITVRCNGANTVVQPNVTLVPQMIAAPASESGPKESPTPKRTGNVVKSPMVGTVYLSSRPGAAQFVRAGEQVKKGQTILIIEAMKVMNQITAPHDGVVAEILVVDKDPVEFDQDLVVFQA